MSKSISVLGTLALLLRGRVQPDLSAVRYSCDEANPYCPDGLDCIGGVCLAPAAATWQMVPGGTDGGASVAGCRYGGGTDLGGGVFACRASLAQRAPMVPESQRALCHGRQHLQHAAHGQPDALQLTTRFLGARSRLANGGGRGNNNYSCQSTNNGQDRRPGLRTVDAESGHGQELCRVHSRA